MRTDIEPEGVPVDLAIALFGFLHRTPGIHQLIDETLPLGIGQRRIG